MHTLRTYLFLLFLVKTLTGWASHIVGGEIYYDFLGKTAANKDIYRVTLKIYRDCNNSTNPDFDGTGKNIAWLSILGGGRDTAIDIGSPAIKKVPPTINSRCAQIPAMCVEEGIYTYTLTLDPVQGGYYLVYQSCCRNNTILNIIHPETLGATYYVWIPGPETASGNSSPRFEDFPPILLCNNLPFKFDHKATDPDGDELEYSFGTPYMGTDPCCAIKSTPSPPGPYCPFPPATCPEFAPPPPYNPLPFQAPFTANAPLSSNPAITINNQTGLINIKPDMNGQFVVSVMVKELRNGKLINTHYRDFQFNIVSCVVSVISDMADQLQKCEGTSITFTNQSTTTVGNLTFKWDFGVPGETADTSRLENPTYQYQDTGKYTVTLIGNPGKDCSDTIRKVIYIYPMLDVKIGPIQQQCITNNSFNFQAAGVLPPTTTFLWNFLGKATPSVSTSKDPVNIVFPAAGTHAVKVTAMYLMCRDSFVTNAVVVEGPKAGILNLPFGKCAPATITFSSSNTSEDNTSYLWHFSDGRSSEEKDPVLVFPKPGIFQATLSITTMGTCKGTSTASANHFTMFAAPKASFYLTPKTTTILDPFVSVISTAEAGLTYEYDFGDNTRAYYHNAEHVYYDYGNYTISQYISDANGCRDSTKEIFQVLPEHRFWIPSAFTPDNNNINDVFRPVMIGVTNYKLEIFDRWGQRIFTTSELAQGWDGSYNDVPCKQDVYAWHVNYTDVLNNTSHQRKGHVTLIKSP